MPLGIPRARATRPLTPRKGAGRLVTVTNGAIFSDPVYNYTRDFPYLWEELTVPIGYAWMAGWTSTVLRLIFGVKT